MCVSKEGIHTKKKMFISIFWFRFREYLGKQVLFLCVDSSAEYQGAGNLRSKLVGFKFKSKIVLKH